MTMMKSGFVGQGESSQVCRVKQVLLIEDDEGIRTAAYDVLTHTGLDVVTANDGLAGVQAALSKVPDLILCDLGLPGLDGYGVIRALRENAKTRNVPLIFASALGDEEDIQQALSVGAVGYLVKPYSRNQLLSAVRKALESSSTMAD